jgi:hypothetical protein
MAACHDGTVGGDSGPVSEDNFPARFAHAVCTRIFECCTSAEIMHDFRSVTPPVTTEAQCEQFYLGFALFADMQYRMDIAAGSLTFDSDIAGGCVDEVANETCAAYAADPGVNACGSPYVGQLAIGASCKMNELCASGYCAGVDFHPPGMCMAKPTMSEPCPDNVCADGLTCSGGLNPTCGPLKADGASCLEPTECASHGCNGSDPTMGTKGTCGVPTTCNGMT